MGLRGAARQIPPAAGGLMLAPIATLALPSWDGAAMTRRSTSDTVACVVGALTVAAFVWAWPFGPVCQRRSGAVAVPR
jgi:hypothetical protein